MEKDLECWSIIGWSRVTSRLLKHARPSGFLNTTTPTAVGMAANSLSPSPLTGQANTVDVIDSLKSRTDREGLCVIQGGSLASSVGPLQDSHYNSREGTGFIST